MIKVTKNEGVFQVDYLLQKIWRISQTIVVVFQYYKIRLVLFCEGIM